MLCDRLQLNVVLLSDHDKACKKLDLVRGEDSLEEDVLLKSLT